MRKTLLSAAALLALALPTNAILGLPSVDPETRTLFTWTTQAPPLYGIYALDDLTAESGTITKISALRLACLVDTDRPQLAVPETFDAQFVNLPTGLTEIRILDSFGVATLASATLEAAPKVTANSPDRYRSTFVTDIPTQPGPNYRIEYRNAAGVAKAGGGAMFVMPTAQDIRPEDGIRTYCAADSSMEDPLAPQAQAMAPPDDPCDGPARTHGQYGFGIYHVTTYGNQLDTDEKELAGMEWSAEYAFRNPCGGLLQDANALMAAVFSAKSDIHGTGHESIYYAFRYEGSEKTDSQRIGYGYEYFGHILTARNARVAMAQPDPIVQATFDSAHSFVEVDSDGSDDLRTVASLIQYGLEKIPFLGQLYDVFNTFSSYYGEPDPTAYTTTERPNGAPGGGATSEHPVTDFDRAGGGVLTWNYQGRGEFNMVFDYDVQVDSWLRACPRCSADSASVVWAAYDTTHRAYLH